MKPSEIIEEIKKNNRKNYPDGQYIEFPIERAIMQYLDEEWEKSCTCQNRSDKDVVHSSGTPCYHI